MNKKASEMSKMMELLLWILGTLVVLAFVGSLFSGGDFQIPIIGTLMERSVG